MKLKLKIFSFCIIFIVFFNLYSFADFSSPINPVAESTSKSVGLFVGFGQNMQSGTAYVNCENCRFTNGLNFGYTIGVSYENQLSTDDEYHLNLFNVGALLHLSNRDIETNYTEIAPQYLPNYDMTIPISFKHYYTASILSAGLMPFVSFNPIKFAFVKLGVDVSYILNNSMEHEQEVLDKKKKLPNGEIVDIYIYNPKTPQKKIYSQIIQNSEIKELNKLQVSLVPSVGINIYITENWIISPSVQYSKALMDISNVGENFKIDNWRINIELKYDFTSSNKIYIK